MLTKFGIRHAQASKASPFRVFAQRLVIRHPQAHAALLHRCKYRRLHAPDLNSQRSPRTDEVVAEIVQGGEPIYHGPFRSVARTRRSRRAFLLIRAPCNGQPLASGGAVAQVQVDERLITDSGFIRQRLEVRNRPLVQPDRDLPFQALRVRVPSRFREIVFLPHRLHRS
jgi:hypothetical protein